MSQGATCISPTSRLTPNAVIWATGYRLDHSFVQLAVFADDGRLVHQRGVTASRGLYFLGLPWQHTRGSALLGWVKDDAEHLAQQIDRSSAATPRRATVRGCDRGLTVIPTDTPDTGDWRRPAGAWGASAG